MAEMMSFADFQRSITNSVILDDLRVVPPAFVRPEFSVLTILGPAHLEHSVSARGSRSAVK